jgi:Ni,Fe-hydrogenase I cytochrome b subunit
LFNWSALILLIVLFASGFFISARMQTYAERKGYLRCPQADRQLSFSTGLVYTKDAPICRRLVEEKRKP